MFKPSGQTVAIACSLVIAAAAAWLLSTRSGLRTIEAGFWFEPVTFRSAELEGSITPEDIAVIDSIARAEIASAFAGLRFRLSDDREAPYRVRVTEGLRDPRFRSPMEVAGASWALTGIGGHGAVSFRFLASGAIAHAPPGADRVAKIQAIGRGIGRSAVHELTHQLLPRAPIHGTDAQSYEFGSASRREQYYGPMHWDTAWPLLCERFGDPAMAPPGGGR